MEHSNNTPAKIPILDTGKFEQWKFRIQQYLQHERYALWEVIEFGYSYVVPTNDTSTVSASEGTATKKGRTVALTTEDMQKRRNDTAQELWAAILKTFGANEATKKTKKNLLKQQYGNFKAEGKKTLEQTFNRLQAIVSQLEFMDVEIEQDDLNQKLLTSLTPEWLMHTIVWRNRSDLDTMSLDDLYNHLKVYEPEVQKKSDSQNMAFISTSKNNSGNEEDNTAGVPTASTQVSTAGATINEDNIAEIDIKWNMALLSMRAAIYWKKTGKNISIQGTDAPKALMAIDEVGWDWSFMANEEENHALVADEEALTEFAMMAKTSADSEVFDNSLCSKNCLSQVEGRLVEFKNQEIKFCEKIRVLKFNNEGNTNRIEYLTKESENLKNEKKGLESKLTGFKSATKDLDHLIGSQRSDKIKEGLGYSAVPPPPAQVYSPSKKDMSWTGLPEFADDTITDYTRPSPSVESNPNDLQNSSSSASENGESTGGILSKPKIKFVRPADTPIVVKTDKVEIAKKPTVKKFPTGNIKFYTADMGNKEKAGNSQNHIDNKGYWDSGCSRHMTGNTSYLSDYEPFDGGYVSFGQGGCKISSKGTIKTGKLEFENVYFVKDLKYNLFSVSQICDNKNIVIFTDLECIVLVRDFKLTNDTNVLLRTPRQHNMYSIDLNNIVPHKDLTCLVAKASADELTDDFSRFTWTFFLKTKDETSVILRNFITEIENLKELRVKIIRCDNGGEFRIKEMNDFCSKKGIKREFSNARTPRQNGVAERRNMTLIEAARTMLADAKLPVNFWAEAVNTACYVQNRVLVNTSQNKTPYELFNEKFEAKGDEGYFIGYSMSSKAFRVFNKRTKRVEEKLHVDFLENKPIEKGVGPNWLFDIDYLTNSMNYMPVVVASTDSTNFSDTKEAAGQDVKKDVSSLRYIVLPNWLHETHLETSTSNAQDACNADAPESSGISNPTATSTNLLADHMETLAVETPIPTVSFSVPTACLNDSPKPSSDTRLIFKRVTSQDDTPSLDNILTLTNRFEDILGVTTNTDGVTTNTDGVEADLGNMETTITASPTPTLRIHKDHPKSQIIEPKKISDALQDPSWVEAMQEEPFQLKIQNVWSLVGYPKRVRPIGTKWVLKNKKDEIGVVIRNKARLVAQGNTQEEEIDYDEVFAHVARIDAIRLFLAYASFMGFTVYQMDVKSAFLYDTIDEEVYVMQPPGFHDPEFPARVYKVEKAMYGLHQAPRAWYGTLSKYLLTNDFQMGTIDQTLFIRRHRGDFILVQVYVDDIIFGSSNPQLCREFEALMHEKFQMSAMDVRSANTPMDKENPWGKDGIGKDVDLHHYRSMIGSLMYLTASRPDIMFVVCVCARHQLTPKECHMHAVKRIFRYLKGHPKPRIWYPKESPFDLVAYSNSDYGGASQDHKSTTGWCQFLGRRLISWQCKKQTIMATSTTEAEYVAAASCCGQVLWIQNQLLDYGLSMPCEDLSKEISSPILLLSFPHVSLSIRSVHVGEGSGTPTESHHTPTSKASQSSHHELPSPSLPPVPTESLSTVIPSDNPSLRQYTRKTRIAQSLVLSPVADEPASPIGDVSQEMISKFALQELEINRLKARIKLLEDKDGGVAEQSGDDAPIKRRRLDEGEEAAERSSDDTEEMAIVLTSMDAAIVTATVSIPTGSGVVSTASPTIPTTAPTFTTATESTPYTRRKGKETMVESETPKKKKVQEQIDVQLARELEEEMDRDTQRMNEQIARDAEIARIHEKRNCRC
nr:hypothetical protein [Tanacetum cinerariifolium]